MTTNTNATNMVVFGGGRDMEMISIQALCEELSIESHFKPFGWDGPKASLYAEEMAKAVAEGKTIVGVELQWDCDQPEGCVIIDHHNEYAGKPAAILQFCELFEIHVTRDIELIAANDAAYIPGMRAIGASDEEVADVRMRDRAAQGITPEQEVEADRAVKALECVGDLIIVRMSHSKCAPVTDRVSEMQKEQAVLILSTSPEGKTEANFYGNGEICEAAYAAFPVPEGSWDNWKGGNLPVNGYWGNSHQEYNLATIKKFIVNYFE